jgi:MFS superfamily sulfate permease-like transporter
MFGTIKQDFSSGIVVFLVALPLCLGISLASGAPFFAGMIAGIVGGIVIGALSGSQLSVSGPAAGLAAVVLSSINKLGAYETFLLAVVIAGVIQLVFGLLKAGTIANYFPSSVIKGMLTGIGIIIIMKQIPHAVGYDTDYEGSLTFIEQDGSNTFSALLHPIMHIHLGATLIALVGLAVLILWERPFMKPVKAIPAGLVAVGLGVGMNELFRAMGSPLALSGDHLVNIPIASSFEQFFGFFQLPDFSQLGNKEVYIVAITIAVIASIETLLCLEAVDKLDPQKRVSSPNRELNAQGIGNILSGMIGGLPITSVIVRSSANVNAGAQSKLSAIIHGVLLLVCVALIPSLLNKIPLAALASILLMTGYKLAKISIFKEMFANGKYLWVPFIVTVVMVVFTDLLTGVGIGLVVSIAALLRGNMKNSYFFHKEQFKEGESIYIKLAEEVSFLNKASIQLTLDHLPSNSTVVIDASNTFYVDYDVLEIIREFNTIKAPLKNIRCVTIGFKDVYKIDNTHHITFEQEAKETLSRVHLQKIMSANSH